MRPVTSNLQRWDNFEVVRADADVSPRRPGPAGLRSTTTSAVDRGRVRRAMKGRIPYGEVGWHVRPLCAGQDAHVLYLECISEAEVLSRTP